MFCQKCGHDLGEQQAAFCPQCGASLNELKNEVTQSETVSVAQAPVEELSQKSFVAALLLCFFFGSFGIHRFYVGKILTGLLMLITLGCFGIWTIIDFIIIVCGSFTDSKGKKIKN